EPALLALMRSKEPAVFLVWHQDFVHTLGWLTLFRRRRPIAALASASRDGGIAAAAAEGSGFSRIARGSSAKQGARGLLGLLRLSRTERSHSIVVVADGPRPPARQLKPGPLLVARDARLPIWAVRTSWFPDSTLSKTWARFHLPRPW